jgi:hypothetical protein
MTADKVVADDGAHDGDHDEADRQDLAENEIQYFSLVVLI